MQFRFFSTKINKNVTFIIAKYNCTRFEIQISKFLLILKPFKGFLLVQSLIISILQKNDNIIELNSLKYETNLSGKKWDKSMKNLAKYNLTKVSVDGDEKTVTYIGE